MSTVVVDIPPEVYERLEEQARKAGKEPGALTRELIETALRLREEPKPRMAREALQAAGRICSLSERLRRRIIPGVTLDEVRGALTQTAGPSLSQIILDQRGPRV